MLAQAGPGTGAPPQGLDEVAAPQKVALVVGLDRYGADPTLQDLKFAAADARAVGDLLEGEGYRVHRVVDTASRVKFLQTLTEATADLQRDDLFLMYFAGHAQLVPGGDTHDLQLLFSDDNGAIGEGLPLDDLADRIDDLAASRRVVLLDTCYSERTQQMLARNRGAATAISAPAVGRFDAWIFSAAPQQSAQEDPELGHGVFTYFLLDTLRGEADVNGDGVVGVLEVYNWVGFHTAQHTGRAQVPWIEESRIGWEDLPLTVVDASGEAVAAIPWYEQVFPGAQVWIDGMTRGPGSLEPGAHVVEVRDSEGDVVMKRRMVVDGGDVLEMDPWLRSAKASLRLGAGVGWTAPMERVPAMSAMIGGWFLPAAPGAIRPAVGGSLGLARGAVGEDSAARVGTVLGRVGVQWQATPQIGLGPAVGVGSTWRTLTEGTRQAQGAPLAEIGLHTSIDVHPLWLGVDLGVRTWQVDTQWVAHPGASIWLGGAF